MAFERIVVVGAGHNALVAAFYLARAGLRPLVLERRAVAGGVAVTEEFCPGFRCSPLAQTAGPLRADVARDLELERHALVMLHPEVRVFAPAPDGRALLLYHDAEKTAAALDKFSHRDAKAYGQFHEAMARVGAVLREALVATPPSLDEPAFGDLWGLWRFLVRFRRLGRKEMFDLMRWLPMPAADFVEEWFETELLRAPLAARAINGAGQGPRSPGSNALLLLRAAAEGDAAGSAAYPRGGLGALADALAAAATRAGAQIRTGAEVSRILVRDGAVAGVVLADGEEIAADVVVSGADPRRTLFGMVDPVHLDPEFVLKLQHYRSAGVVAKVHLALDGLPSFAALRDLDAEGNGAARAALTARIHIGPEVDYLERSFDASKYGRFSELPYLEATVPSILDPSLAPPGKHVMSVHMQYAPYALRETNWDGAREALGDTVVKTLSEYAPDLPARILHRQVLTPVDIEKTYGLTGGHLHHGELGLDQLFSMRPLMTCAQYRAPIGGLYLCGSGTHPGIGLTGGSGANAAREVLRDIRR